MLAEWGKAVTMEELQTSERGGIESLIGGLYPERAKRVCKHLLSDEISQEPCYSKR